MWGSGQGTDRTPAPGRQARSRAAAAAAAAGCKPERSAAATAPWEGWLGSACAGTAGPSPRLSRPRTGASSTAVGRAWLPQPRRTRRTGTVAAATPRGGLAAGAAYRGSCAGLV